MSPLSREPQEGLLKGARGTSLAWAARPVQPLLRLLHNKDSLLHVFLQSHSWKRWPRLRERQSKVLGQEGRRLGPTPEGHPPHLLVRFTHAQGWGRTPEDAGGREAIPGTGQGGAGHVWSPGLVALRVPAPQPRPLLCEAGRALPRPLAPLPGFTQDLESWTIKKAERRRIDAFELWCWRRLLRVPWTARRSNQSILKELSPEYSLEGLMLKLKLQYFGHLMRRADSLEKTLMLRKIEGRRRRG